MSILALRVMKFVYYILKEKIVREVPIFRQNDVYLQKVSSKSDLKWDIY